MSVARERRTYRVQQLPPWLQLNQVADFLVAACACIGLAENIKAHSIAKSLSFVSLVARTVQVATITFTKTPLIFDDDEEQWSIPGEHDRWSRNIIFDVHFRGFTALNDTSSNEQQLDCIAISGLASHPFGSWKQRGANSNFMWLRDQVPMDLPHVRCIIYGYDTKLSDKQSFKDINDLALALIEDLRTIRKSTSKAIVFLAHSLGGIVLKRAVVNIANSGANEDQLLGKIPMICFFGVPNQGMHIEHLLAMVEGQPNQSLVQSLSAQSSHLSELDIQFTGLAIFRKIRFISVYETKKSLTTKEIAPGHWVRSEPYEILVQRSSAIQRGTSELDYFPVDEDHSNLVKFAESSQAYQNICARLEEALDLGHESSHAHRVVNASVNITDNADQDIKLLESLDVAGTSQRQADIERAFADTFDWVYENEELDLPSWLRGDGNIFWIRGKPGSGKSTLMKFLHDSKDTSSCINAWQTQRKVLCCWFFFYARGSFIQKSFEGLLHSILYQMTWKEPRVAQLILPLYLKARVAKSQRGVAPSQQSTWSLEELNAAFVAILEQNLFPLRLYLFLDALDEYDGQPQLVAEFITSITEPRIATMTQVKVCFSSRPWNVFIKNFDSYPGFSIHDYTKHDIWRYTEKRLVECLVTPTVYDQSLDMSGQALAEPDTNETERNDPIDLQVTKLIAAVVDKARGVFLWVRLVLDQFLERADDGASLEELHELLSTLPEELEEFYDKILQRVPKLYLAESYDMMELVLRSEKKLTLWNFADALACAACRTFQEGTYMMHSELRPNRFPQAFKLRIASRCGGLVEILGVGAEATVQFMHQTVQELVSKPGFRQRILGAYGESAGGNGHTILAKYYFSAPLTHLGIHDPRPGETNVRVLAEKKIDLATFHARQSELTTGLDLAEFLNSIDQQWLVSWLGLGGPYSILELAAITDLRLYVTSELQARPSSVSLKIVPMLHAIVKHTMIGRRALRSAGGFFPSLGPMCDILLKLGISLGNNYAGQSPFVSLFKFYWEGHPADTIGRPSREMVDVVQAFLNNGQSPNIEISSDSRLNTFCRPLHLARSRLSTMLLQHGADVNALDSDHLTALDLVISSDGLSENQIIFFGVAKKYRQEWTAQEVLETTTILSENGGCITWYGGCHLKTFVKNHEKSYPFAEILKNIPYLPGPEIPSEVELEGLSDVEPSLPSSMSFRADKKASSRQKPSRLSRTWRSLKSHGNQNK